jgi:copper transport protein
MKFIMYRRKKYLLVFVVLFLYCAWAVTPALAHAMLIRSNPSPNAVLAQAPAQIELFFSETVEASLSTISVYDSTGKAVDLGDVRVDPSDPTRMTVSLGSLSDGVYTVAWKAISATDGHLTTGSFPFAIGNVTPAVFAGQTEKNSSQLPTSALIAKWLLLASLAVIIGQRPFIAFVWNPVVHAADNLFPKEASQPKIWSTISTLGLIALFIGLALSLLSQAGQATGNELALPWAPETGRVALETRLGLIWFIRLGLAFLEVWLLKSRSAGWKSWLSFAAGLALLFTISLTSHAATGAQPMIPILSDSIHLTAMSFWLGGLPYLLTGFLVLRRLGGPLQTRIASMCMGRYSILALASVSAIGVTGLYAAYLRVGTLDALFTTIYGDALLSKQTYVALLLLAGALNLLLISPRLKKDRLAGVSNTPLVAFFSLLVVGEIILAGFLLATVSVLTYLPPAKITVPSTDLNGSIHTADLQVDLTISPGFVGQNTFTLKLRSNNQPVQSVKEALLRFTPSQSNVSPSEAQLLSQGNGAYVTKGSYLSLPGDWQIQAVIRRDNQFDAFANFNFPVSAPGTNREFAGTQNVAGGLIVLDGLLFFLAMSSFRSIRILHFGPSGILTILIAFLGMYYCTRPIVSINTQANPIAPNPQSLAAGQAVYEAHCAVCHGEDGKGDGPLGLTLLPRPANFVIHGVPGVHTDEQWFEWISDGFPGSAMPAWRSTLSDTDRWNLVNYIRTFAPKTQP